MGVGQTRPAAVFGRWPGKVITKRAIGSDAAFTQFPGLNGAGRNAERGRKFGLRHPQTLS